MKQPCFPKLFTVKLLMNRDLTQCKAIALKKVGDPTDHHAANCQGLGPCPRKCRQLKVLCGYTVYSSPVYCSIIFAINRFLGIHSFRLPTRVGTGSMLLGSSMHSFIFVGTANQQIPPKFQNTTHLSVIYNALTQACQSNMNHQ